MTWHFFFKTSQEAHDLNVNQDALDLMWGALHREAPPPVSSPPTLFLCSPTFSHCSVHGELRENSFRTHPIPTADQHKKSPAIYVTSHGGCWPFTRTQTHWTARFSRRQSIRWCVRVTGGGFDFRGQTCRLSTLHSNGLYQPQCRESRRLEEGRSGCLIIFAFRLVPRATPAATSAA